MIDSPENGPDAKIEEFRLDLRRELGPHAAALVEAWDSPDGSEEKPLTNAPETE